MSKTKAVWQKAAALNLAMTGPGRQGGLRGSEEGASGQWNSTLDNLEGKFILIS